MVDSEMIFYHKDRREDTFDDKQNKLGEESGVNVVGVSPQQKKLNITYTQARIDIGRNRGHHRGHHRGRNRGRNRGQYHGHHRGHYRGYIVVTR
ncbi:hypothetical protein G6F37_014012 [Rhizopus arrhizus]|nr:hypothetical protein G6F37_014012 [Rhizopus arrhizus]